MNESEYYKYTMPLDRNFEDKIWEISYSWNMKFAWLPHRCQLSKRIIWLEFAYCGSTKYCKDQWRSSMQHLIWLLKE